MKSTTYLAGIQLPPKEHRVEARSLYQVLQEVTDGRKKRGRRYEAAEVLTIIVLAKMAGEKAVSGIAHWARLRLDWLGQLLPLKRGTLPCANTYQYICDHIALDELNEKPGLYFAAVRGTAAEPEAEIPDGPAVERGALHLALDGKSLRGTAGTGTRPLTAVQLIGLYHVTQQYVLRQVEVPGPGQERKTALRLMKEMDLRGCLVSADALYTQPAWCQQILAQGGDYLLIAKRNQPTLQEDIALLFSQQPVPWLPEQAARSVNKGHGRIEVRYLRTSSELGDYLAPKWPAIGQVFQIERRITRDHRTTTEVAYGLTSLSLKQAPAPRLLHLIRDHWHIENRLHWRRDVTLGEDACRVRLGQTPQVLAALNNAVLALMDYLDVDNVPAQIRAFGARPAAALALLLSPL
jgi:predicted transposase YbfD/YdcC